MRTRFSGERGCATDHNVQTAAGWTETSRSVWELHVNNMQSYEDCLNVERTAENRTSSGGSRRRMSLPQAQKPVLDCVFIDCLLNSSDRASFCWCRNSEKLIVSDCWLWKSNQQSLTWHYIYRSSRTLNQIPSPRNLFHFQNQDIVFAGNTHKGCANIWPRVCVACTPIQ